SSVAAGATMQQRPAASSDPREPLRLTRLPGGSSAHIELLPANAAGRDAQLSEAGGEGLHHRWRPAHVDPRTEPPRGVVHHRVWRSARRKLPASKEYQRQETPWASR